MFAPPPVALFTIPFIYNIIFHHPALLRLIHRRDKVIKRYRPSTFRVRTQFATVAPSEGVDDSGSEDSSEHSSDEDDSGSDGSDGSDDDSGSESEDGDDDDDEEDEDDDEEDDDDDDEDGEEEEDGVDAEEADADGKRKGSAGLASAPKRVRTGEGEGAGAGAGAGAGTEAAAGAGGPGASSSLLLPAPVLRPSGPIVSSTDGVDVYDAATGDLKKCRALESSLWELTVLQTHHNPVVSALASMFSGKMVKQRRAVDVRGVPPLCCVFVCLFVGGCAQSPSHSLFPSRKLLLICVWKLCG
jgi:hypothetical protein